MMNLIRINFLYSDSDMIENEEETDDNNMGSNFQIQTNCTKCKTGYYEKEGKCEKLNVDECSFLSIINSLNLDKLEGCLEFCQNKEYSTINYYYENIVPLITSNSVNRSLFKGLNLHGSYAMFGLSKNMSGIIDFNHILNNMNPILKTQLSESFEILKTRINAGINLFSGDFLSLLVKALMCVDNSGFGEKISPKNLRKCKLAEYNEINDTYTCTECVLGYALDNVTQTCKQSIKISFKEKPGLSNCYTTILGTKKEPKYSCVR